MRTTATAVALVLSLSGCAAPVPETSSQPLPELAEPAAELPVEERPASRVPQPTTPATDDPGPEPSVGGPTSAPSTPESAPPDDGSSPTTAPTTAAATTTLVTVTDATGDAGLETPPRADLVEVVLTDLGSALRITVDVAADVPARLAEGEVVGLGIDLFVTGADESDYQLFADGGADGWSAYLQTPDGFIDYPGTFAIGGRRLRFEVPWTAVGAPARAEVAVFLDWSQARTLVNASGSDRAPDRGRAVFDRS